MKQPEDDAIDINLDAEPMGESPLTAAAEAAAASLDTISAEDAQQAVLARLAQLQAEKDDLYQTLIRRQADFENYRKRIEKERKEDSYRAAWILIEGFLPVLDAFERALSGSGEGATDQYRIGFEMIYKQFLDALTRLGLERIEAVGKPFDPFYHQAVERVETNEAADGIVIEELQHGYKVKDKVLRPTMVRVAIRPADAQSAVESAG